MSEPFPPIADYALLSDCETVALVAPVGSIEWLCLPRPDAPSVFGAMLDRDAGRFRLGPVDVRVPTSRRYLPGTLVLETTWHCGSGWLTVRDALTIGPWDEHSERTVGYRRPPADHRARHRLLRSARCTHGTVELELFCEPFFEYGTTRASWRYDSSGYQSAVTDGHPGAPALGLSTSMRLGLEGGIARAYTRLRKGERAFVALSWASDEPLLTAEDAARELEGTSWFWRQWLARSSLPDHRWRAHLERSALVLRGLSYAPTGAMLAAATTSLPETPGGERNWDYRFTWIRDATFALWSLHTLGFDREAADFFAFIADVTESRDELQIMYGLDGETDLTERFLPHLSGYGGARPVRIGNGAFDQEQHDVWGALIDSVYLHTKSRDEFPDRAWPIVERQVENAIDAWRRPDRGLWEVRGEPRHFTSSKVMCWVAADRGARLATLREQHDLAGRWRSAADDIREDVCRNGVNRRGVFTQHYDTDALDASLLLLPLVRFLPRDDPRVRATIVAIADELTEDGLVLRYRVEETDDGLSGEEGTFTICSFWLASAFVEIGEIERGRRLCERLLALASPLGLYGEEIDVGAGRHLGNFPQAFSHLALINAVMHVVQAERTGSRGRFEPA